jgi:hypothetical protein
MMTSQAWAEKLRQFIGKTDYLKHLKGKRLTPQAAINAACFRCSSGYDTGLGCSSPDCPLVPFNPYNRKKK